MSTYNNIKSKLEELNVAVNSLQNTGITTSPKDIDANMISVNLLLAESASLISALADKNDSKPDFFKTESTLSAVQVNELQELYGKALVAYGEKLGTSTKIIEHIFGHVVKDRKLVDVINNHNQPISVAMAA